MIGMFLGVEEKVEEALLNGKSPVLMMLEDSPAFMIGSIGFGWDLPDLLRQVAKNWEENLSREFSGFYHRRHETTSLGVAISTDLEVFNLIGGIWALSDMPELLRETADKIDNKLYEELGLRKSES